jgi:hypothetical protein
MNISVGKTQADRSRETISQCGGVLVPLDFTGAEDGPQENGYDVSYRASFDAALATVREAHAGEVVALRGQLDQ